MIFENSKLPSDLNYFISHKSALELAIYKLSLQAVFEKDNSIVLQVNFREDLIAIK